MTSTSLDPAVARHTTWMRRRAALRYFGRQLWGSLPGRVGLLLLLVFVLLALAAPLIADRAGLDTAVARANGVPQWADPGEHPPLGTDYLRRSVWSTILYGSRISLFVGLAATVVTIALGSIIGVVSGFVGGRTDSVLMRVTEWFLVIPFLPLAIVLASVLGRSIWNIIFVIGVTSWPSTARLVRAQVLTVKHRVFVDRARSLGASRAHIVFRHIMPNVSGLILANATLAVPISILTETTLSFLGLGDPRQPSWGKTLVEAFENGAITLRAWWYFVPAGVGIVLVVLAFTLVGQTLEQIADPRLKERR